MFGPNLRSARRKSGLTQAELASRLGTTHSHIVKLETGKLRAKWDDAIRLAGVLGVPLQWFITGHRRPPLGIQKIVHELRYYGIRDLAREGPVPGAYRRVEEILVLAVRGNRPQVRVVEAIPVILAKHPIDAGLIIAFSHRIDRRAKVRIAWLAAVTELLGQQSVLTIEDECAKGLETIQNKVKPSPDGDSLGIPAQKNPPPIWKRWNITYDGRPESFTKRIQEVNDAQSV